MKAIKCDLCGSNEFIKEDGYFVCQYCKTKYTVDEAKKMMIEGHVDVSGSTVKIDNSDSIKKYLENARRARQKEDWEEAQKYYDMVEQNEPKNIEAIFFSSYAKLRVTILEDYSSKWQNAFRVLNKSISVIDDYFDMNNEEENRNIVISVVDAIIYLSNSLKNKMIIGRAVNKNKAFYPYPYIVKQTSYLYPELNKSLDNIAKKYEEAKKDSSYIKELKLKIYRAPKPACYIATCVYGSYDCPEVWTLRRYRDYKLEKTRGGKLFIKIYYAISPKLVIAFGENETFQKVWKSILDKMVTRLQNEGYKSTPYKD